MSWQHPQNGDEAPRVYGVYDAETTAGAYEQYADPAAAHGWYEAQPAPAPGPAYGEEAPAGPEPGPSYADADAYDDLISTAPLPAVAAPDAAASDSAVFVDASGRRRVLMRRVALVMSGVCVVFLGVVIFGLFGSGPAGGPLPWGHGKGDAEAPHAEHSPSASPTARPGTPAQPAPPEATGPSASASPSAGRSDSAPPAKATSSAPATSTAPTAPTAGTASTAPATTAPTATAPTQGSAGTNPGRGHGAPGSTKGPK